MQALVDILILIKKKLIHRKILPLPLPFNDETYSAMRIIILTTILLCKVCM